MPTISMTRLICALVGAVATVSVLLAAHAETLVCSAASYVSASEAPTADCALPGSVPGTRFAAPLMPASPQATGDAEATRQAERHHADQALLRNYDNQAEVRVAQARYVARVEATIVAAADKVWHLVQQRKRLESEAEFYVRSKMPDRLVVDIAANEAEVVHQYQLIAKADATRTALQVK